MTTPSRIAAAVAVAAGLLLSTQAIASDVSSDRRYQSARSRLEGQVAAEPVEAPAATTTAGPARAAPGGERLACACSHKA